jgi:TonB family protein
MARIARGSLAIPALLILLSAGCTGLIARRYVNPSPLFTPQPVYPEEAYAQRAKGLVQLGVAIDKYGAVTEVDVLKEDPPGLGFASSAVEAVRQWVWTPARQNGGDAASGWRVTLKFDPDKTPKAPITPVLVRRTEVVKPGEGAGPYPTGMVLLQVDVTEDGTAGSIRVVREMPRGQGLAGAAVRCVRQWQWIPGLSGQAYVLVPFGEEKTAGEQQ